MSPQSTRETLLARTITVIANEGLDKTTTKAIVAGTGINEAYIYRSFSNKEDLLSKAFELLDEELVAKAMLHAPVMYINQMGYETRCMFYFSAMWDFLLGNREKCLAFVRYYYSPYFEKYSVEDHKMRYQPLAEIFSKAFRDDVDVWMILNYILSVMLNFAVKVHNGQMPNEEAYAEYLFRVIYASVKQYFKNEGACVVQ